VKAAIVSLYETILEKMEPQPDADARWQERFESRHDLISQRSIPQPTARSRAKRRSRALREFRIPSLSDNGNSGQNYTCTS
jgi:hypothetical protein